MSRELVPSPTPAVFPAWLFTPTPKAAKRVVEFFTTQISNDHTRQAYDAPLSTYLRLPKGFEESRDLGRKWSSSSDSWFGRYSKRRSIIVDLF